MNSEPPDPDQQTRPALWNPNAAALWSLFLTPAFGAYLHASNWRALGRPDRAAANMSWVWLTLVFMVFSLGTPFLPKSAFVDSGLRFSGLWLVVSWYLFEGKRQILEVNALVDGYPKRPWGKPLALGIALLFVYLGLAVVVLAAKASSRQNIHSSAGGRLALSISPPPLAPAKGGPTQDNLTAGVHARPYRLRR